MQFSLTNPPAVFWVQVNEVLRDVLNKYVYIYLDSILIFSTSKEKRLHPIQAVPQVPAGQLSFRQGQKVQVSRCLCLIADNVACRWTPPRCQLSRFGLSLNHGNSCKAPGVRHLFPEKGPIQRNSAVQARLNLCVPAQGLLWLLHPVLCS